MADGEGQRRLEPPYNLEAEAAVLGAILFDNAALDRVREHLGAEDFHAPAHRVIYERINALVGEGRVADGVTLRADFERDNQLKAIGGASYLFDCLKAAAFGREIGDYSAVVADLARRRALIEAGQLLAQSAHIEPSELCLEAHETALDDLRETRSGAQPVFTAADISFEHDRSDYLATGYPTIDRILSGLGRGKVAVLGGRPSMGKSALAIDILYLIARAGHTCGFFSLEMPANEVKLRATLFGAWLRKPGFALPEMSDVIDGKATDTQMALLRDVSQSEEMSRLYISDRGGLAVTDMGAQMRLWRRHAERLGNAPPSVVCVDHMLHVRPSQRTHGLNHQLTDVSAGLLAFAKNHHVAMLALSQLSRRCEIENRKPNMSDLRESGAIEQDAHAAMFLYREDYYLERALSRGEYDGEERMEKLELLDRVRGRAELIIEKNRSGRCGVVDLRHSVGHNLFRDTDWRAG